MEKFFEKDGVMDSEGHVRIMQLSDVADRDADFLWEQLVEYYDEKGLAVIVNYLTRLYVQRKMKAIYWAFAYMKGNGIALPPYILTGAAFAMQELTLFYFGAFFLRITYRMQENMEDQGMEEFVFNQLMA